MGWPRDVGIDLAIAKLFRFWWWCVDYAPDGDLHSRGFDDDQLASAAVLSGDDASRFVKAMVEACWLDREPYFRVHDWWDYFGSFLRIKYKDSPDKWKRVRDLYRNSVNAGDKEKATELVTDTVTDTVTRTTNQTNQPDRTNHHHQSDDPASGDELDQKIREYIHSHPMLVWTAKAHSEFRAMARGAPWPDVVSAIDAAISEGASHPTAYARQVLSSRQAKGRIESEKSSVTDAKRAANRKAIAEALARKAAKK